MILAAADGDVILANPAMRAMLGRAPDDLASSRRADVIDPDDPSLQAYVEERERTGRARAEADPASRGRHNVPGRQYSSVIFTDAARQKGDSTDVRNASEAAQAP